MQAVQRSQEQLSRPRVALGESFKSGHTNHCRKQCMSLWRMCFPSSVPSRFPSSRCRGLPPKVAPLGWIPENVPEKLDPIVRPEKFSDVKTTLPTTSFL
jgi:hypothetical protein